MRKKTRVTISTDSKSALTVESGNLGITITSEIRTSPRTKYEKLDSALFVSQNLPIVKVEVDQWLNEQAYQEDEWLDETMQIVEKII